MTGMGGAVDDIACDEEMVIVPEASGSVEILYLGVDEIGNTTDIEGADELPVPRETVFRETPCGSQPSIFENVGVGEGLDDVVENRDVMLRFVSVEADPITVAEEG